MSNEQKTPGEQLSHREAGELRIRAALEHIEEAQIEIGRAIADLSAVRGFVREGERLQKLYDRIRAEWDRVTYAKKPRGADETYRELDRETQQHDENPHYHGCGIAKHGRMTMIGKKTSPKPTRGPNYVAAEPVADTPDSAAAKASVARSVMDAAAGALCSPETK